MYVVILGCGRVGGYVAGELSAQGHSVVVVDKDPEAFKDLPAGYSGFTLIRNASEFDALEEAKIAQADLVVAATQDDNLNLMVASFARDLFGVKQVIARVVDPRTKAIGEALGLAISCSTELVGRDMMSQIKGEAL